MILLNQKYDKKSREFKDKNKTKFDEVLEYPECLERFPNVAKFPAAVWIVPEEEIIASLYNLSIEIPNYEYFAIRVGYLIEEHNKLLKNQFCDIGGVAGNCEKLWFEQYAEDKGLLNADIIYLIEVVNFGDIPAFILAWTFRDLYSKGETEKPWDGNVGVRTTKFKDKLKEESKTRSVMSLDESVGLIQVIPAKDYIFYPDEFEDIDKEIKKIKKDKKIMLY